jgi:carnitine O-acetyltransferase
MYVAVFLWSGKSAKHLIVIVCDNGRSGFLGEHSCMDGTPTLRLNEFMLASIAAAKADLSPMRTSDTGKNLPLPKEITFVLDSKSKANIRGAEQRFDELVGEHDLRVRFALNSQLVTIFDLW